MKAAGRERETSRVLARKATDARRRQDAGGADRAVRRLRRGDRDAARADFRATLCLDPNDAQARRLLAELDGR